MVVVAEQDVVGGGRARRDLGTVGSLLGVLLKGSQPRVFGHQDHHLIIARRLLRHALHLRLYRALSLVLLLLVESVVGSPIGHLLRLAVDEAGLLHQKRGLGGRRGRRHAYLVGVGAARGVLLQLVLLL